MWMRTQGSKERYVQYSSAARCQDKDTAVRCLYVACLYGYERRMILVYLWVVLMRPLNFQATVSNNPCGAAEGKVAELPA